jgi:hypothetical protein
MPRYISRAGYKSANGSPLILALVAQTIRKCLMQAPIKCPLVLSLLHLREWIFFAWRVVAVMNIVFRTNTLFTNGETAAGRSATVAES